MPYESRSARRVAFGGARSAADKRDWREVVRLTADPALISEHPRANQLRISAALELQDEELLQAEVARCSASEIDPPIRYGAVLPLLKFQRPELAWTVLTGDPEIAQQPDFVLQAKRVLKQATGDLRRDILSIIPTPKSLRQYSSKSTISAPASTISPRPLGNVSLFQSSMTGSEHLLRLTEEVAKFKADANPIEIREVTDVFVDEYGQIWREEGEVYQTYGAPIPELRRGDCPTVPIGIPGMRKTKGIYHWLIDIMPRFNVVLHSKDLPILMATNRPSYERESLTLLGVPNDRIINVSGPVFVSRLILPSVNLAALRHWGSSGTVFERMLAAARKLSPQPPSGKVYITRRSAPRRRLSNEEAVESVFAERGYSIVAMEKMPLAEQILLANSATEIAGPHGAGLAHAVFARPGTPLAELLPVSRNNYQLRFNYARLALALGLNYRAWVEPQIERQNEWSIQMDEMLSSDFLVCLRSAALSVAYGNGQLSGPVGG